MKTSIIIAAVVLFAATPAFAKTTIIHPIDAIAYPIAEVVDFPVDPTPVPVPTPTETPAESSRVHHGSSGSKAKTNVVKYNSNTGELLAPGKSFMDLQTGQVLTEGQVLN